MSTEDFNAAVDKLVKGGLPRPAAYQLMSNAVTRGEPIGLLAWADHLLEARRKFDELKKKVPS